MFDDVRYKVGDGRRRSTTIDSEEGPYSSDRKLPGRQPRPPPADQGRLFPGAAGGQHRDLRAEMLSTMGEMGLKVEKHHHEVAPSQHELGFEF